MFGLFNLREFLSSFVVLFAIIDVIGNTPVVISILDSGKKIKPLQASIMSFLMFVVFFYAGEAFLNLFHVDLTSFAVAGAMIVFILSLEMILNVHIFNDSAEISKDATFTPVVFPLIVGAGSLTTLLSIRSQYQDINILLAIVANVILVYIMLKLARRVEKFLGPSLIYITQKMFGIILLAISVKLFITNLSTLIKTLS